MMAWPLAADSNASRNDTFVCVASGPSLTDEQCRIVASLKESGRAKVIAINDSYRKVPTADYLFASDEPWWRMHFGDVKRNFAGQCFTVSEGAARVYGLTYIEGVNLRGLNKRPGVINTGGNGGYMSVGLAYQLLARRIILVAYDYQKTDNKAHWFGDHPYGLSRSHPYRSWLERFPQLAADVKREGIEMFNCSEATALTCVPRVSLARMVALLP